MADFNPNELVLEKVRAVEEYDPDTKTLTGRYTQIEDPSLKVEAEGTDVTDAMGAPIMTFYNAQKGTFEFTNSLFSLDLAASQFGSDKVAGTSEAKITVPVSEILTIDAEHKVTLTNEPVGIKGAEIKNAYVINGNNTFGKMYTISATTGADSFTYANKVLTFPENVTGKVFVTYETKKEDAVEIVKTANSEPKIKSLLIHAIFHDPCNKNTVYAGVISCPRAQIDPSSIELSLKSDGKHGATYNLQSEYCSEDGKLFSIIVSK